MRTIITRRRGAVRLARVAMCFPLLAAACRYDSTYGSPYPDVSTSISLTPATVAPLTSAGDTVRVKAVVRDAAQRVVPFPNINWHSSAPSVATVALHGSETLVTAVNDGTAVITATDGLGTSQSDVATLTITVRRAVASVVVSGNGTVLAPGETQLFSAFALDARGNVIPSVSGFSYTSSNPARVNVSPAGIVTAILPADPVTIVASITRDGFTVSGTASMRVFAALTFDYASLLLGSNVRPVPVVTDAEGLAFFRVSGDRLQYQFTWTGLSGPALFVRLEGPATEVGRGNTLVSIAPANHTTPWGTAAGSITAADIRSPDETPPISLDSLITLMRRNLVNVNIRTAANLNGEIRGQVEGPFR